MNTTTLTFSKALEGFLRSLEGKNRSPLTMRAYQADINQFVDWLGENNSCATDPAKVERVDITEYLASLGERDIMGVSRARKLAAIREFFLFLEVNQNIEKSPTQGIETPKKERIGRVYLRPEEYRAMLAQAGAHPRDYAILQVFLQTGVRVSELCDLRLPAIDFEGRTIRPAPRGGSRCSG